MNRCNTGVVIFIAGVLQGQSLMLMFLTAISLAVAAIPEALPAVVTAQVGTAFTYQGEALERRVRPLVETVTDPSRGRRPPPPGGFATDRSEVGSTSCGMSAAACAPPPNTKALAAADSPMNSRRLADPMTAPFLVPSNSGSFLV